MAEGKKTLINNSGKDITVTLFIRDGDSPRDEGGHESYDLSASAPGNELEVIYVGDAGSLGYVYLNALLAEWAEGANMVGVSRRVVTRSDAWDDLLNTNDTVTIDSLTAGQLDATGSN